jgi:hypothetical protein
MDRDMRKNICRIKAIYFSSALVFLLSGILIYALYRNSSLLAFEWFGNPRLFERMYIPQTITQPLSMLLVYSLPDGLWLLSGILLLRAIWLPDEKLCRIYVIAFCSLGILSEIFQLHEIIPGTFDMWDLSVMTVTIFTEGIIYKNFGKKEIIVC